MTDNDVQKLKQMYGCSGNYKLYIGSIFARFVERAHIYKVQSDRLTVWFDSEKIKILKVLSKGGFGNCTIFHEW